MSSPRSVALHDDGSPLAIRRAAARHRRRRRPLAVVAVVVLFVELAPDAVRNSISWPGYLVLGGFLFAATIVMLAVVRPSLSPARLPRFLWLFLVWITLSIAWSFYPGVSALGSLLQWSIAVAGTALALCLTGAELLACLSLALRGILGLSLVFEAVVAVIIRHPILPFWVTGYPAHPPESFYWSRGLLFHGGRIQGIVGNSNLLAMVALLAAIVVGAQLADHRIGRGSGIAWLVVAGSIFALTRSSTTILAAFIVAIVFVFVLVTRRRPQASRRAVYAIAALVVAALVAGSVVARPVALVILGKSDDITGRIEIWRRVTALAVERPVVGWGWTSYWAPWVEPFTHLAERRGTLYLQAHDAWLDVWFQVGIIGLVLFVLLVAITWVRSWFLAVDRPRTSLAADAPYSAATMVPLLLLAALLTQSIAESRLIVEGGWLLLVILAVRLKRLVG